LKREIVLAAALLMKEIANVNVLRKYKRLAKIKDITGC